MSDKREQSGGACPWQSVGALVYRGDAVLLIHRARFPISWAPPAGHLDEIREGTLEDPKDAVVRELSEEVGLRAARPDDTQKLLEETLQNSCRRVNPDNGARYDSHHWWVYRFEVQDDFQPILQKQEATEWQWANREETLRIIAEGAMDPAWTEIFALVDARTEK